MGSIGNACKMSEDERKRACAIIRAHALQLLHTARDRMEWVFDTQQCKHKKRGIVKVQCEINNGKMRLSGPEWRSRGEVLNICRISKRTTEDIVRCIDNYNPFREILLLVMSYNVSNCHSGQEPVFLPDYSFFHTIVNVEDYYREQVPSPARTPPLPSSAIGSPYMGTPERRASPALQVSS